MTFLWSINTARQQAHWYTHRIKYLVGWWIFQWQVRSFKGKINIIAGRLLNIHPGVVETQEWRHCLSLLFLFLTEECLKSLLSSSLHSQLSLSKVFVFFSGHPPSFSLLAFPWQLGLYKNMSFAMATMECISRCMCWWALHLNGPLCLEAQTAAELRPPLLWKGPLSEE